MYKNPIFCDVEFTNILEGSGSRVRLKYSIVVSLLMLFLLVIMQLLMYRAEGIYIIW